MTCSYCGTRIAESEHRCRRCGRRPDDTLTGEFSLARTDGALATKPQLAVSPAPAPRPDALAPKVVPQSPTSQPGRRLRVEPGSDDNLARAIQPTLFPDRSNS